MAGFNRVVLIGNLTHDPEMRYTPSGTAVVDCSIAVTEKRGRDKEETCFIDCTIWGKTAEAVSNYLAKGRQVAVEGRLAQEEWESRDGTKRKKHKIQVDRVVFLGDRGSGGSRKSGSARDAAPETRRAPKKEPEPVDDDIDMNCAASTGEAADDIPF